MNATLYQKHGKYHISVSWMQDGKRHRKSKATGLAVQGNKRKAQKMAESFLSEMQEKVTEGFTEILFADYLKRWLSDIRNDVAESTHDEYRRQLYNRICPWFEAKKIKLVDLKAYHIDEFYHKKMQQDNVSAKTVHRYHANIRKALQRAVQLDMIPSNPADKVTLPKAKKFRGGYYTPDELQKLISCVHGNRFETVVLLASYLGVRAGEACGLRWKDIDFEKNLISIRGSLKVRDKYNDLYYGETKTESSYRSLPIPSNLLLYLRQLKTKQLQQRMLCGASYNREWLGYVCVNEVGDIMNPKGVSRYFGEFLDKHNLRRIRFHDLRHSCATLLLENGATMKQVQEWLGHHSYVVTADTYGHVLVESKRNMADTMSKLLNEKQTG